MNHSKNNKDSFFSDLKSLMPPPPGEILHTKKDVISAIMDLGHTRNGAERVYYLLRPTLPMFRASLISWNKRRLQKKPRKSYKNIMAYELRQKGLSYSEIGRAMKIWKGSAFKLVRRGARALGKEDNELTPIAKGEANMDGK